MTTQTSQSNKLRVVVLGGGVAAVETTLALAQLAPELTEVTVVAPNAELVYRPMTVREPFSYSEAKRYPLARLAQDAGAALLEGEMSWIDSPARTVHTKSGSTIEYDALVVALGAHAHKRYEHALTIDDRRLDEQLHGVIEDLEGGYIKSLAFVAPGRMGWQLPLYELALMSAARAEDMQVQCAITVLTPEDSPLGIFGSTASDAVAGLLRDANIESVNSAYVEIPRMGELVVNPGDRRVHVDRVIALPELFGPAVRGIPLAQHGFIRVDRHGRVFDTERIYACGDATDFAIKHGGIGSQQADAVQPDHSRDAADGRAPPVSDGAHHRWTWLQLGSYRHGDVVASEQDRGAVSRPIPGGARQSARAHLRSGRHGCS
jgi:sulfide:quinone oxidoreductase